LIVPAIIAAAAQTEQERGLPLPVLERLKRAGLFRMLVPTAYGGEEMTPLQVLRVVEELARADGSAGWTGMVAAGFHPLLGLFPRVIVNEVLADGPDVMVRGALAPKGRLTPVAGGYRISGQWPLASGSYPYRWVIANGLVFEDGRPRLGTDGRAQMRMVLVPAEQARFLDTWNSVGLCGSASHDFVLDEIFVAEDRLGSLMGASLFDNPLMKLPFPVITAPQHTAVTTGIALGALDDLATLAATKRPAFRPDKKLIDDPVFRHRYGELVVRLDAARGYADWLTELSWELAQSGTRATLVDVARVKSMVAHVSLACVDIVNDAFTLAGASAVYQGATLQRRWRDVRVASQHAAASADEYQALGGGVLDGVAAELTKLAPSTAAPSPA